MSDIRVFCVENHLEYMGALKYKLERGGYEVTPATTADSRHRATCGFSGLGMTGLWLNI